MLFRQNNGTYRQNFTIDFSNARFSLKSNFSYSKTGIDIFQFFFTDTAVANLSTGKLISYTSFIISYYFLAL